MHAQSHVDSTVVMITRLVVHACSVMLLCVCVCVCVSMCVWGGGGGGEVHIMHAKYLH